MIRLTFEMLAFLSYGMPTRKKSTMSQVHILLRIRREPEEPHVFPVDEDNQEEFDLHALLYVTINDWPALSNLSGQTNKGYRACTHCLDDTDNIYIWIIVRRMCTWDIVDFFRAGVP